MNAAAPSSVTAPGANPTVREAWQSGTRRLADAGIDGAALDAEVLLRHALRLERGEFYLRLAEPLHPAARRTFAGLVARRAAREPCAYITAVKEFWSLDFIVTPAVLIPRPETELLVELALASLDAARRAGPVKILDIGTGSGAIAVALAKELPESEVWATDISGAALGVAWANAQRHRVEQRMRFQRSDLFPAPSGKDMMFDLITSNPPYVRTAELNGLAPEVRQWEPLAALDGGPDGLKFYRRIIAAAANYLKPGGRMLLEVGPDLAARVVELCAAQGGYAPAEVHRDYAGRERVVTAAEGLRHG